MAGYMIVQGTGKNKVYLRKIEAKEDDKKKPTPGKIGNVAIYTPDQEQGMWFPDRKTAEDLIQGEPVLKKRARVEGIRGMWRGKNAVQRPRDAYKPQQPYKFNEWRRYGHGAY